VTRLRARSLPDSFLVRNGTLADVGAAAEIIRAEEALRGRSNWEAADVSDFWRNANFSGAAWFGALGVLKPWRRRGIGSAVLRHAFAEFHRRGESHVGLGVEAQNPTAAKRLYEQAGMRVIKEDVVYEKELE
jgi:GNAT superfamily N-acetyltransferase